MIERLKEIMSGSEVTRKEYLELLRMETGLSKEEFYPAIGNLLKHKVIYFSNYETE